MHLGGEGSDSTETTQKKAKNLVSLSPDLFDLVCLLLLAVHANLWISCTSYVGGGRAVLIFCTVYPVRD